MKTLKTEIKLYSIFLMVAVFSFTFNGCREEVKPVYVEYFKNGQVLLPDYAVSDTLIVVDAEGLNKAMAMEEQGINDYGDSEIDSIFHHYSKIK